MGLNCVKANIKLVKTVFILKTRGFQKKLYIKLFSFYVLRNCFGVQIWLLGQYQAQHSEKVKRNFVQQDAYLTFFLYIFTWKKICLGKPGSWCVLCWNKCKSKENKKVKVLLCTKVKIALDIFSNGKCIPSRWDKEGNFKYLCYANELILSSKKNGNDHKKPLSQPFFM